MAKHNRMIPIASSVEFSTKPKTTHIQEENILIQIPECRVFLKNEGEPHKLTQGQFTIIKIGNNVQFPLTKDEDKPVVKVDSLHYLFSLPVKDGHEPLSYGVTFPHEFSGSMDLLDSFLDEYSYFSDCSDFIDLRLTEKGFRLRRLLTNHGPKKVSYYKILYDLQ